MFDKMRFRFQPSGEGMDQVLGELESRIMRLVWTDPGATAREIHARLAPPRLAYTTILTVLDRLHGKGLVARERKGRRFSYTPAIDRVEFEARITRDVLEGLLRDGSRPVLNTFVDLVAADETLLDELEQLIRERRK
jgi:predicted transcriptional regulator